MTKMKRILSEIGKGKTIDELVGYLDMSKPVLLAMVEFMVDEAYLEKMGVSTCSACHFGSKCSTKDERVKMYVLTQKAEEFLGEE
ncbi:MAG: hypothetical protein ACXQTP_01305 [Candidatus Methanofastidiosia archaeon]